MSETEEYEPSLRQCLVMRPAKGSCGFHLSRTQWDPYPWVSEVEPASAADRAGLVVGDCVLEVNGEDVLGLRIGAVALRVYARGDQVRLLVWNSGVEYNGSIWSSGSGPTPLSLQRLASCLQSVVALLECPVCLETIPPPAFQCCNGHTLCGVCRSLTDRCPICRVALGPRGRCLLADKLHMLFAATFLKSGGKKQKRSKPWIRQVPALHMPSRLLPRIVPTPSVDCSTGPVQHIYHCPLDSCGSMIKSCDLLPHLQHHGEGPLVQYFCKDSSTYLRFPVTRLTTITLSKTLTFVLHAVPHPAAASCLLLWLWIASEDSSSYRLQLELPGRATVRGQVFPLSWTTQQVLSLAADKCIVLNDDDLDASCTKVKITILSKCDSTTI